MEGQSLFFPVTTMDFDEFGRQHDRTPNHAITHIFFRFHAFTQYRKNWVENRSFYEITQKNLVFTKSRCNFMLFSHHAQKSFQTFKQIFFRFYVFPQEKRPSTQSRRPMGLNFIQSLILRGWTLLMGNTRPDCF